MEQTPTSPITSFYPQLDTTSTAEDDSCFSLELDLLNRRATRSSRRLRNRPSKNEDNERLNLSKSPLITSYYHQHPVVNRKIVEGKLLPRKTDKIATPRHIANVESSASYNHFNKYDESQVTFEEKYLSQGERFDRKFHEKLWRLMYCTDNRKQNRTPRIIRAIRENSGKFDSKVDQTTRTTSSDRPRVGNSKSSVVVLYHGRYGTPLSTSSKALAQFSKSDRTIVETSRASPEEVVDLERAKIIETPETLSPRYPPRRRKISRRYCRASRQRHSLSVNIYHANGIEGTAVSPSLQRRCWTAPEEKLEINSKYKELSSDSVESQQERTFIRCANVRQTCIKREQICKKQCSAIEIVDPKPMDYRPNSSQIKKTEDRKDRERSESCSNSRSTVVLQQQQQQQVQIHSRKTNNVNRRAFVSVNESGETNRVFPFQATPSGNLKVIPNQVVFESKKFSVLVANPRDTKVNVKAELSRSGVDVGTSIFGSSDRTKYIDLPPGITQSAIDRLQARKKLPYIEANCKSSIPITRFNVLEMEQEQIQPTSRQLPAMNEVPLASLGFTNEQPINWDNIILPEKTDLYQELARRITNYMNADCIVRIDEDEFYCHLLVLQSYSAFFNEKNYKDIDLSGSNVTSKAFSLIYDWMISPISESYQLLRRDNILEIFTAAQYLGIRELEEQCWAFIDNDALFSEDTAFLLYLQAKRIGNTAVMELMVPRIMKFFLMLVSTKDFLELSMDELCSLLKSNYICVNSEMEILMSAVRWLMHDWNNRKQHMLEVLKCVRFGLIAPWQLIDVKRNPENPEFIELMSYPEVQKMVDDGLAFVIIKYWYGNQMENYYHWIDLLGLNEPTDRNWAGEDKNYVTYREFLLYLEEYQKMNISELKARKMREKPTPPDSPPKDCPSPLLPEKTHTDCNQNTMHRGIDSHLLEQYNTTQIKTTKKYTSKVATSSGMTIRPKILTECLVDTGKNMRTIKNLSLERKQTAQKVAELLSISTNGWSLQKSLNPIGASSGIANQNKNVHHV